jgi:ubiquinone/menaquinone biosynthesis C-methylase UbiE
MMSDLGDRLRLLGRGAEVERVRSMLGLRPGVRLLDVGGRTGAFTSEFARGIETVVVLEPDTASVRSGAVRHPSIRFLAGRGEEIPYPASSFDRVTAIRSTHHMASPDRFLGEAYRVLGSGGRIVLEELSPSSGLARFFSLLAGHHHPPMEFRDASGWENALRAAGFADVRTAVGRRWYFVRGTKVAPTAGAPAPVPPLGTDRTPAA